MSRSILSLLLLLGTFSVAGRGQTPPVPLAPQTEADSSKLVRMHDAWGPKASTPGMGLVLKEVSRSHGVVDLQMVTTGVPKEKIYTLVEWPVTAAGPQEMIAGVTLNAKGVAMCGGTSPLLCGSKDKPNDVIDNLAEPVPGEPVRLGLVSSDGTVSVFAKVVPVPLEGKDHGCTVGATLLTPQSEVVMIEGNGFPPNGELTLDADSEGERHVATLKANSDGHLAIKMLPFKAGLKKGTVTVMLKSAGCSPAVKVPWGVRG